MALAESILVCLTDAPMTGYDLGKAFQTSIGFFWAATHQQIYRELAKLRDKGLVQVQEVIQSGKPNRLVYSITADGRAHLRAWSMRASDPPSIKDDMLVRFYALDHVDVPALREQVALRLDHHRGRVARYEKIRERMFANKKLNTSGIGRQLGLELGLRYERGLAEWCEDALRRLADLPADVVSRQTARALHRKALPE
jgi:DNA-binding PadR family transcriptional regulator